MKKESLLQAWQIFRHNPTFRSILWWGLAIGLIAGCSFNRYNGYDWIVCFRPQALEMDHNQILNPMCTC